MNEVASVPQQRSLSAPNSPPVQQLPRQQAAPPYVASHSTEIPANAPASQFSSASNLLAWTPWLAGVYVVGVTVMLLCLGRGLWQNYRLLAQARLIGSGPLFNLLQSLAHCWSLRVTPALALTERVIVPQVVGLWRPVILLPAAALAGLRADELEMILAHELAHVRRHDLWANLVQRLAEAVLFFNPAVWYLSRRISTYREYCCDEATCRHANHDSAETRVRYAQALWLRRGTQRRHSPRRQTGRESRGNGPRTLGIAAAGCREALRRTPARARASLAYGLAGAGCGYRILARSPFVVAACGAIRN